MNDLEDVVKEFLVESYENLDQLDRDLAALAQNPTSQSTLGSIFRTLHTIKGTCGFLRLGKLESVTHAGETLLSSLRDGEAPFRDDFATALLRLVDAIREILANIESIGAEGETDYTDLIQTLVEAQNKAGPGNLLTTGAFRAAERPVQRRREIPDTPSRLLKKGTGSERDIILTQDDARSRGACPLFQQAASAPLVTTRLQPIANVWSKLPRIVRDFAAQCGKQVRVEMEGDEAELDPTTLQAIKDSLTHLVRNAIAHGIESPQSRLAAGKPREGRILLRAWHEGGQVIIEMIDDGGGLDIECIRRKAVERGLVTQGQADRMSDRDVAQLILAPGFSTAAAVTHVSGRGVGLDVVKTNIEKIGGTVRVHSQPGRGTTIKLTIPLALAIIPARLVT